jgi:K+-sensing histidine kinase KdpD
VGSRPAFLTSVAAVLCLNFFFLPPYHTFTIADSHNWAAFVAFLITALTAGQLSGYARRRAAESEERMQEIERLYTELQEAFDQASQAEALRQSEQLKSALLDAVTHDIRTPLTSIKASVTTLLEDVKRDGSSDENVLALDNEGREEFLEIIDEETDRLNKFVGEMVELARIEAGKMNLRRIWTEVPEVISNALERAAARLSGHKVTMEIESELPTVRVDAPSIAEVVYVLLDNAAKYSAEGSALRVSARRGTGETVEIAVEDEGKGIAPEMREKVFEKFHRASEGSSGHYPGGLGMGLAIARGIIESQGGRIWSEDGVGEFTTKFVFSVPIGDD